PRDLGGREIGPESDVILLRLGVQAREFRRVGRGVFSEMHGRLEYPRFAQDRLYVLLSHDLTPQPASAMRRACWRSMLPNPWVSKNASSPALSGRRGLRSSSVASSGMSQ